MTTTMSKKAQAKQQAQESQDFLRLVFSKQERPTVWTSLKHVSSSGMSRDMKALTVIEGEIVDITWHVAHASGVARLAERNGQRVVRIHGCGMDMGFHLVHSLSYGLYEGDGYQLRHEWI